MLCVHRAGCAVYSWVVAPRASAEAGQPRVMHAGAFGIGAALLMLLPFAFTSARQTWRAEFLQHSCVR